MMEENQNRKSFHCFIQIVFISILFYIFYKALTVFVCPIIHVKT